MAIKQTLNPLDAHRGQEFIVIRGARTHNLKNIDLKLPRNHMIAITGLSGSGKSSLAFDTIFAASYRMIFMNDEFLLFLKHYTTI